MAYLFAYDKSLLNNVENELLSFKPSYPFYQLRPSNEINVDRLLSGINNKLNEIIKEHRSEDVLSKPYTNFGNTNEYVGARLTHSMLIGRPFIIGFTGSSNTAGHDNV